MTAIPSEADLDRHSPLHEILSCMLNALKVLSSNEYIYADDGNNTTIHQEEVEVVINLLSHFKVCAVEIADSV